MTDDSTANNSPPSRIPDFQTLEEEAEFWDTHDITDYLDEMRPVRVRFGPKLKRGNDSTSSGDEDA